MSAKHPKKTATPPEPAASNSAASSHISAATVAEPSWLESTDPRKQLWGKIIFAGVWIYVGALCLLALDQTFHWGIFGPKVPPLP